MIGRQLCNAGTLKAAMVANAQSPAPTAITGRGFINADESGGGAGSESGDIACHRNLGA